MNQDLIANNDNFDFEAAAGRENNSSSNAQPLIGGYSNSNSHENKLKFG